MKEVVSLFWFFIFIGICAFVYEHAQVFGVIFGLIVFGYLMVIVMGIVRAIGRAVIRVAGWTDYKFVKHPAEPVMDPVLRKGRELDTNALQQALMPTSRDLNLKRPIFHHNNQTKKAQAITRKLEENARLAEAAIRLERTRAELRDAQRELDEAKRKSRRRRWL